MAGSDLYRDCFWCGHVYDIWRHACCPECGSGIDGSGWLGGLAGRFNQRLDYSGPDYTQELTERQAKIDERESTER